MSAADWLFVVLALVGLAVVLLVDAWVRRRDVDVAVRRLESFAQHPSGRGPK